MKYLKLDGLEVIAVFSQKTTVGVIAVPDDFDAVPRQSLYSIPGTILSQEQINTYTAQYTELQSRQQRVINEIQSLIGLSVLSLTDAQRWKLVGAVFYKLGVINSSGVVNPYSDWLDIS
jgi:hypothetical protein